MGDNRRTTRIAVGRDTQIEHDGNCYDVRITDISYGGVQVMTDVDIPLEAEVKLIDADMGELDGLVVRKFEGGFAVAARPGKSMATYALKAITLDMVRK